MKMDPHAFTAPFQFTKTMRRELYPEIDPTNPELTAAGKTVLITGATGGIGGVSACHCSQTQVSSMLMMN